MTKPMPLSAFTRLPPVGRACPLDGLSAAIDLVAEAAPASHRFLRYQYYAAALALHGGAARTLLVEHDGDAVIALPFVRYGPAAARLATVPGVDGPFRGFPVAQGAADASYEILIDALANDCNMLRVGPVADDDAGFAALRGAALRRGWLVLDRPVAARAVPDFVDVAPTDRYQLDGAALAAGEFDVLVAIDNTAALAFWRAAAADSVLAAMLTAMVVSHGDRPTAFALHLDTGSARHLVASGGDMALREVPFAMPMREWLMVRPGLSALVGRIFGGSWLRHPVDRCIAASL